MNRGNFLENIHYQPSNHNQNLAGTSGSILPSIVYVYQRVSDAKPGSPDLD